MVLCLCCTYGEDKLGQKMEAQKALFVLLIIGLLCTARGADTSFMAVQKKTSLTKGKSGSEQVTVSIKLYNLGSTTAYDVSLNDDSWSADTFSLISGNKSALWDKLDAGASVFHSFILESNVKGIFYGAPAVVKYRVAAKSVLQEAYSTPIQPLDILAERPPEKRYEWAKKLLVKYGPLASVLSIVGLFIIMMVSPSSSKYAKSSKKRR